MDNRQTVCQCGAILLTADEIYSHINNTGHRIRDTFYRVEDYHLVEQMLSKWSLELSAAADMLQGKHLEQFKQIIATLATKLNLQVSDTGTFEKSDE